ncbi:MAG: hypothetical protein HY901_02745 [Deltaproteobacteria bacterium]|nr:hypothetical protein [Deltaproteobacteria bacterium]
MTHPLITRVLMASLALVAAAVACNDGLPEVLSLGSLAQPLETPYKVKTLRPQAPATNPSALADGTHFVTLGEISYFAADNGIDGRELWRTDGTAAGTWFVKDVLPGAGSSSPRGLCALGSTLFFNADDGVHGPELWKSDGTATGTELVKDGCPGKSGRCQLASGYGRGPELLTAAGSLVYYSSDDGNYRRTLWRSDGTENGTLQLDAAGQPIYDIVKIVAVGSQVFVSTASSYSTGALYVSDGTAAGTRLLTGTGWDGAGGMIAYQGKLYFGLAGALWKSDGTVAGTVAVATLGGSSSAPKELAVVGSTLYFSFVDTTGDLWKSDGTEGGTVLVKADVGSFRGPQNLIGVNGLLVFAGYDLAQGWTPWVSDGTSANTAMLKNVSLYDQAAFNSFVVQPGPSETLFFRASTSTAGQELWRTDGTALNTVQVKDLAPGSASSVTGYTRLAMGNGFLLMAATDGVRGIEPYRSNGTDSSTFLIKDLSTGFSSSHPHLMTGYGPWTYFAADDGVWGMELWRTDGREVCTQRVTDLVSGASGSNPADLFTSTVTGSERLYFTALGQPGHELWRSDGTDAGLAVIDVYPGTSYGSSKSSYPREPVVLGGRIFFFTENNAQGTPGLWSSDGATATLVKALYPWDDSYLSELTVVGDRLFFRGVTNSDDLELWTSDGTPAGTVRVKDIWPGASASTPKELTAFGDKLVFVASDGVSGFELWTSDGTEAGTTLLKDIRPGSAPDEYQQAPVGLTEVAGTLFFAADDGTHGLELWKSDGTTAGTVLVADLAVGAAGSSPHSGVSAMGRFFFVANAGEGDRLWVSDGTAQGTVRVADLSAEVPDGGTLFAVTPDGGPVLFSASNGITGFEPWITSGASAQPVGDINPGTASSHPRDFAVANGHIYFVANDGRGEELWAVTFGPTDAGPCPGVPGPDAGRDAAAPGPDAAAPGPDAATPGPDAAAPGPDAAAPGPDAAAAGPDAAAAGPDAAAAGPDAAAAGPDAAAAGPDAAAAGPDAAAAGPDAAAAGPDAAAAGPDAATAGPDAWRDAGSGHDAGSADSARPPDPDAGVPPGIDATVVVGIDAAAQPGLDASSGQDAREGLKDAADEMNTDAGPEMVAETGCGCGSTGSPASMAAFLLLFGLRPLFVRRMR